MKKHLRARLFALFATAAAAAGCNAGGIDSVPIFVGVDSGRPSSATGRGGAGGVGGTGGGGAGGVVPDADGGGDAIDAGQVDALPPVADASAGDAAADEALDGGGPTDTSTEASTIDADGSAVDGEASTGDASTGDGSTGDGLTSEASTGDGSTGDGLTSEASTSEASTNEASIAP